MDAKIALCKIEENGTYKYIQIECINRSNKEDKKLLIRGNSYSSYHKDIFRKFMIDIMNSDDNALKENFEFECVGGGRIDFGPSKIFIYGYSTAYGQADHAKTKEIVQKFYPTYEVEFSNDGY